MKLYYAPDSIALAPHIALEESGLPHQIELIDHHGDKMCVDGRSYFQLNPGGYVPTLELADGTVITESIAVLRYIGDQAEQTGLSGTGTADSYQVLAWMAFVATELHQRFMRFAQPEITDPMRASTLAQLRERFAHADKSLENRDYLVGDTLTTADIFLYVAARWLKYIDVDVQDWPSLGRFYKQVDTRPAVRRAVQAEGLEA